MPQRAHYPLFSLIFISTTQATLVDLSTLSALTWVMLIAAALFALMLPAKEPTGVMLALLLIGDAIALWAYRRDANTAILRRLVPSVLAGVGLGALLLAVSTQVPMHRGST